MIDISDIRAPWLLKSNPATLSACVQSNMPALVERAAAVPDPATRELIQDLLILVGYLAGCSAGNQSAMHAATMGDNGR